MKTQATETVGEYVTPMTKIMAVKLHTVLCISTAEEGNQEYDRIDTEDWF